MTDVTPLTVVGGYLGAGKTTLVNHLLRHAGGRRLAVLVNDFGALPIDADLIESRDENVIGIAGGCVCCSYGSDLLQALIDLATRTPLPDHVLVETSGVALPGAVASAVTLVAGYRIDGIVVVVDAETVRRLAADRYLGDTIERQLADAHIVLLNKADLTPPAAIEDTRAWLAAHAPAATIVPVERTVVPVEVVLGLRLGHVPPGGLDLGRHSTAGYVTHAFPLTDACDVDALARGLATAGLLRAKGFVNSRDGSTHLVQVVGGRSEVTPYDGPGQRGFVTIGLTGSADRKTIEDIVRAATPAH